MRNEPTLKTLCRGLEILEYLAERPEGATNKEVASYFGMDPSSSFRFLQTLVHCRFVCKENGKYYLSHRLLGPLNPVLSGGDRFHRWLSSFGKPCGRPRRSGERQSPPACELQSRETCAIARKRFGKGPAGLS